MRVFTSLVLSIVSLPSRERGLKFAVLGRVRVGKSVAPFTGAWIEIYVCRHCHSPAEVAPFTGAWIEMAPCLPSSPAIRSLPSRERGLKCRSTLLPLVPTCRSLHGSVD